MAGNLTAKERAIITLTSTGASITTLSAAVANATADFDARSTGNFPDDLQAQFELTVQWATITGITVNTVVADLYLLPILDGTNAPDIDLTSGSSALPYSAYAGSFVATKAPTANTNARFVTGNVPFNPALLRPYILNRSGQTMTANWTLKAVGVQGQYT
jgi:hypothetical protein